MYKSFRVKNFRCFKDLQINDLGRVNLIAGKNNTGKTALMEAMYLHSGNREPRTLLRVDPRTSFRTSREIVARDSEDDAANIIKWTTAFRDFNPQLLIELTAELEQPQLPLLRESAQQCVTARILSEESGDYIQVLNDFGIEDYEVHRSTEILEVGSDYNSKPGFYILVNGRVLSARIRTKPLFASEFFEAMKRTSSRINAQRFSHLRQSTGTASITRALEVIESRLESLELLYDGYRTPIYANLGMNQLMPLSSMGEGMNRMTSLILALTDEPIGVIFVDEIENGLHHSIQSEFWRVIGDLARNHRVQVFATTHSLEMIRAAYKAFSEAGKLDEFRYHRLDRYGDEDIEAVTYNEFGVEAAMTTDWEVRG